MNKPAFAFFGTSNISVIVLDKLKAQGYLPKLIVTVEDKPKGRKMVLTPSETKVWADQNKIPYLQLKTLKTPEAEKEILSHSKEGFDLFLVVSYGKIIPQNILDIPKFKTLNVHPSLLPKLRGPSPIKSAILTEEETGVTIMRLDEQMDHGPIVAQKKIDIEWPPYEEDLEKTAGQIGGEMLLEIIPDWILGKIPEIQQNHSEATTCVKIQKSDGEINLADSPEVNLRKIRAFHIWPTAYFFKENNGLKTRIIVKKAHIENDTLVIERVVPEGRKEMNYQDFLRGQKN